MRLNSGDLASFVLWHRSGLGWGVVLTSEGLESFATFSSMPEAHVQIHS